MNFGKFKEQKAIMSNLTARAAEEAQRTQGFESKGGKQSQKVLPGFLGVSLRNEYWVNKEDSSCFLFLPCIKIDCYACCALTLVVIPAPHQAWVVIPAKAGIQWGAG